MVRSELRLETCVQTIIVFTIPSWYLHTQALKCMVLFQYASVRIAYFKSLWHCPFPR